MDAQFLTQLNVNGIALANSIWTVWPSPIDLQLSLPRSQVTIPICPNSTATDDVLYEGAIDTSQKFYLPRYRILELNRQVKVDFKPNGSAWSLTIDLEAYPNPAIEELARNAQVINHSVTVILRHLLMLGNANGGQKELVFETAALETQGQMRVVLMIATLNQRDLLYQVLTNADYGAVLVVRRSISVAFADTTSPPTSVVSSGTGTLRGTWLFDFDTGAETSEGADVWWEQKTHTERCMVPRVNAKIVNLGVIDFEAFSPEQLPGLPYSVTPIDGSIDPLNRNQLVNGDVFAVLTNGGNYAKVQVLAYDYNLQIRWITYRLGTSEPLFLENSVVVDQKYERDPFVFPPNLYAHIFSSITDVNPQQFRSDLRSVKGHSYYQDPVQRYIFYYLPDRFKLRRRPEFPRYPLVSVRFSAVEAAATEVQATIEYWAYPFVDLVRLSAAAPELKQFITDPLPPDVKELVFQPLAANEPRLFLTLLKPDGTPGTEEYEDVLVELRAGFRDSRTFSLSEFQSVYDALFSDATQLFKGQVKVDLPDRPSEIIPFDARMNDLLGECFSITKAIDPTTGIATIMLQNQIESPIRINRLTATLLYSEAQAPGIVNQAFPTELPPSQSLTFTVSPGAVPNPLQPSPNEVTLDLSDIQVLADREAIWNAILRPDSPAHYQRSITVKTRKAVFGEQIDVISLDFRRGDSIDFNRDDPSPSPEAQRTILASISDLVLHREDSGTYEYRVMLILKNGEKVQDPPNQWRTETSETLWITNDELPKIEV
jgi:hypothetical protein